MGLVATEAIGKNEVVAVKGGHIVSTVRLRTLSDRLRNSEIQITDDLHLAALADDEYEAVMLFTTHRATPSDRRTSSRSATALVHVARSPARAANAARFRKP